MSLDDEIAATQEVLQPLIAKPALKEKLLQKPPFRFVHDVFSAVTVATGFAEGLFDDRPDLTDGKAIKEKQAKLDYLDRCILCIAHHVGEPLNVRAAKIVAGMEPENTNRMFQLLAKAAKQGNNPSAVQKAVEGRDPEESAAGGGGAGAKDDDGAKDVRPDPRLDDAAPGPDAAQSKPPASRGGRRAAPDKSEDAPPRSGGMEMGAMNYDRYVEECTGEVEVTIRMLGKVIQKPKLTEKLLAKPPFRFLHDIFTAVTAATGFGEGLLEEDEKDAKSIKEKEAKLNYLEKIKNLVGAALNTMVEARPAKIVAGMEPENTNRLLQLLAVAATHCPDSTNAVAMVKGGGEGGAAPEPAAAKDEPAAPQTQERDMGPTSSSAQAVAAPSAAAQAKQESMGAPSSSAMGAKGDEDKPFSAGGGGASSGGGGGGGDTELDLAGDGDGEQKRSMRPTTARRRPPKVKENVRQLETAGVGGSAAAAGNSAAKARIQVEGDDADSDDEEEKKDGDELGGAGVVADKFEGASKLVQDIERETNAGEAKGGEEESKENGKKGIRLGSLKKTGADAKKGSSNWSEQDVETLRVSVQKLCQSTNPLGKCMDFVHEDLSAMSKEHERWQQEYREKFDQLEDEQKKTAEATNPLTMQLLDLDEQLKEATAKIIAMKAKIAKNDQRIEQILNSVVTAS